ncbi:MAG: retroviral-like aspartic protease family protein [Vampirovibrionales bacterium]|jgi:clan AA aspartic protease (TIGR02281 family)|nr:retroviral-like aspartic protease family protein [Vampirovibrionales bacterium]
MTMLPLPSWEKTKVLLERSCLILMGVSALLIVLSYHPDAVEKQWHSTVAEKTAVFQDGTAWANASTTKAMQSVTASAVASNSSRRLSLEDPHSLAPNTQATQASNWLAELASNIGNNLQENLQGKSSPVPLPSLPSLPQPTDNVVVSRTAGPFASVPMSLKPKALFIQVKINDRATGHFILDTGATYTTISKRMARQLGLDLENSEKIAITTANGELDVPKVRLKTVAVNGIEASDVEATVMDFGEGNSFAGLLGLSFIQHFKLTLDPKNGQMIFEPI